MHVEIRWFFMCMCECCHLVLGYFQCIFSSICSVSVNYLEICTCGRNLRGFSLFSVFSAGVLCAYAANQNLSSQLKTMRRLVNSNLKDLYTFANNTPAVRTPASRSLDRWTGWVILEDKWMKGKMDGMTYQMIHQRVDYRVDGWVGWTGGWINIGRNWWLKEWMVESISE